MKAEDVKLTQLLEGPKQFIVPVFQRDYSWGTKNCLQLWNDILRVGRDDHAKAHFVGSVVYIAAEETSAKITRWLLIDGQQRLTTLAILLAALRDHLPVEDDDDLPHDEDGLPSRVELDDYYLCNMHGKGDRRYKLHLRRADHETLRALIDGKEFAKESSERIRENFEFFQEKMADADLDVIYRGIKKLVAVDVCLTRGQDDPQMIFESLNSTGVDLTQADLIRNFVLMRQDEETQTRLYHDYWQPIELAFGSRYRTDFDKFARDYLTLHLRPSTPIKAAEIYHQFRNYYLSVAATTSIEDVLAKLRRFGNYYVAFILGQEEQPALADVFRRLRHLGEVVSPTILRLYECYAETKSLSLTEFVEAAELLESYMFRRSVCAMQTRNFNQIFPMLASRIKDESPLISMKVALHRLGKKRRFPIDVEFREALETRDVYDMRHCHYLLDRLENDSKEKIDTTSFSIEHVMPQNENLGPEWQAMLGPEWMAIRDVWLHRLGNVTLTGYNPEYSDRSFEDKKSIDGGFHDSPLRLNKFIREQAKWTPEEMEARGKQLAERAVKVWPGLVADLDAVRAAELEERKATAAKYSIDKLELDAVSEALFEALRPQVQLLGEDIVELCGPKSVTYRVFDFFLEIIPRKQKLALILNLDFAECDDPSQQATDATEYAFIPNASENGGVLFSVTAEDQIPDAMHLIRQAYEKVSE